MTIGEQEIHEPSRDTDVSAQEFRRIVRTRDEVRMALASREATQKLRQAQRHPTRRDVKFVQGQWICLETAGDDSVRKAGRTRQRQMDRARSSHPSRRACSLAGDAQTHLEMQCGSNSSGDASRSAQLSFSTATSLPDISATSGRRDRDPQRSTSPGPEGSPSGEATARNDDDGRTWIASGGGALQASATRQMRRRHHHRGQRLEISALGRRPRPRWEERRFRRQGLRLENRSPRWEVPPATTVHQDRSERELPPPQRLPCCTTTTTIPIQDHATRTSWRSTARARCNDVRCLGRRGAELESASRIAIGIVGTAESERPTPSELLPSLPE